MSYSAVDATIQKWARTHALNILTDGGGYESRFCYVSGLVDESFQIVIRVPAEVTIDVVARSIETRDNEELYEEWKVPIAELQLTLEAAYNKIREWRMRKTGG